MPDVLNETCHCISLDEDALVRHFDAALVRDGGLPQLLVGREHLFAPTPCSPIRRNGTRCRR